MYCLWYCRACPIVLQTTVSGEIPAMEVRVLHWTSSLAESADVIHYWKSMVETICCAYALFCWDICSFWLYI